MLIDTHCHLIHDKHTKGPLEMVNSASEWDIQKMICIGTSIEDNKPVLKLISEIPNVYGSIGIYPHEDMDIPIDDVIKSLRIQIESNAKIVAIGECGIDITDWANGRTLDQQIILFEEQIKLAIEKSLPVIVHNRNGDEQVADLVEKYAPKGLRGVIHCFVSDLEFAQKMLNAGFYLSFAGNITYPSNHAYREIVSEVPLDRLLIETDSPYLPPQGYRGQVNEPKYVKIVAEKVAEIKKIPFEEVAIATSENAQKLFNLI